MGKKVGIVSLGYAWMPCEPGPSRFYYIAKMLSDHGYDVDVITTGFQHFEKRPRDILKIQQQNYPFHITFIDVPKYKKNVDVRRVYSNKVAERRVIHYLRTQKFDVIYCSIPANNIAATVAEYCHRNEIPFVVDIEDLWPEAMRMMKIPSMIKKPIFHYFYKDAERTYSCTSGVVGTSEEYTQRPFLNQKKQVPSCTVYVGCELDEFDDGTASFEKEIEKNRNEFWVTYAGSLATSYDIRTLICAAKELETFANIKVKILGTGASKDAFVHLAEELHCKNVEFLGYIPYKKMAAYLSKSNVLINSFVKGAPQSIVNKIGDYLAAGKPMINTLENDEFKRMVDTRQFGINIEPENTKELSGAILGYYQNPNKACEHGENARTAAEELFDRKKTYKKIMEIIEIVCRN